MTVAVFRRNAASKEPNLWNLLGKYHSHYLPIRDVLFGPPASCFNVPRFFSLGEDRELVEYDLERRFGIVNCISYYVTRENWDLYVARRNYPCQQTINILFCKHSKEYKFQFYHFDYSGPYPVPGLQILRVDRVEQSAIPLCLAWYPEFGAERFLVISNSKVITWVPSSRHEGA